MAKEKRVLSEAQNIKELRVVLHSVRTVWAGDTRFAATALMFVAKKLAAIETLLAAQVAAPRKKRRPSKWQRFYGDGMKAGKAPKQIADEWRARKGGAM